MYLLIDNYDSFTYILHHYLLLTGHACTVVKNDALSITAIETMAPERIILSPGPETPLQAGITMQVMAHFHDKIPILGVCLGHQAIGMYFGATLVHTAPMHGKTSLVHHYGHSLFKGIAAPFTAMRYHSLAIEGLAGTGLQAIAHSTDGVLMGLAHEHYPCVGLQFHPESVGTECGQQLLRNWAAMQFPNY